MVVGSRALGTASYFIHHLKTELVHVLKSNSTAIATLTKLCKEPDHQMQLLPVHHLLQF